MRISDWSSDVCSSDLAYLGAATVNQVLATSISSEASTEAVGQNLAPAVTNSVATQWGLFQKKLDYYSSVKMRIGGVRVPVMPPGDKLNMSAVNRAIQDPTYFRNAFLRGFASSIGRSEEHTSELQSLMRISYAVFCLKKKQQ